MKILLADDDKLERAALRELLGALPLLEVIEVDNGQAALDLLCDGLQPDLCIFDIRMPQIDGVELLNRVRRDPQLRSLKVVISSASRDRDTIVALAKLQISGYLLKPYDAAKTQAVLKPFLAASAADPKLASRNLLAKTALIVEDDDLARQALEGLIKTQAGWEVIAAKDGQDALTRLQQGLRPDLTLVDLVMPGLDGITLITRIREDPALRTLRIAVMSGYQDRDKIAVLVALGVSAFLAKPFDAAKLAALLGIAPTSVESASPAVLPSASATTPPPALAAN